jgi:hypothetical protein
MIGWISCNHGVREFEGVLSKSPCNSAGMRNLEGSKKQIMFHFT